MLLSVDYSCGNSNCGLAQRNIRQNNRICPNSRMVANFDIPQNLGTGAYIDMAAYFRGALSIIGAYRNLLE